MHRSLTLVLVIALPLAGCLGNEEPVDSAALTNATMMADGNATADLADAANATGVSAMPIATPISYAGSSPTGVCAFLVPVGCHYAQPGSEDYHQIPVAGQPQRLTLTFTIGEQLPGMAFYVGLCNGEGEDESSVDCGDYTTGESPITVDWDLSTFAPGTTFGVSIGSLNEQALMTGTLVLGPADFTVEGTLLAYAS